MLNLEASQIDYSIPAIVAVSTTVNDEGLALVIDGAYGNGVTVKPSTNNSSERFYGISMFERRPPPLMTDVFEFTFPTTTPSDGDVVAELPFPPTSTTDGRLGVFVNGVWTSDLADALESGKRGIVISGRSVTVKTNSGNAWHVGPVTEGITDGIPDGATVQIRYDYVPSQAQAVALVGTSINLSPLGAGANMTCIRKGIVYTSNYDVSQNYKVGDQLSAWSKGRFSKHTGNSDNTNLDLPTDRVTCVHAPSADNPFLGVELL